MNVFVDSGTFAAAVLGEPRFEACRVVLPDEIVGGLEGCESRAGGRVLQARSRAICNLAPKSPRAARLRDTMANPCGHYLLNRVLADGVYETIALGIGLVVRRWPPIGS